MGRQKHILWNLGETLKLLPSLTCTVSVFLSMLSCPVNSVSVGICRPPWGPVGWWGLPLSELVLISAGLWCWELVFIVGLYCWHSQTCWGSQHLVCMGLSVSLMFQQLPSYPVTVLAPPVPLLSTESLVGALAWCSGSWENQRVPWSHCAHGSRSSWTPSHGSPRSGGLCGTAASWKFWWKQHSPALKSSDAEGVLLVLPNPRVSPQGCSATVPPHVWLPELFTQALSFLCFVLFSWFSFSSPGPPESCNSVHHPSLRVTSVTLSKAWERWGHCMAIFVRFCPGPPPSPVS